MNVDVHTVIANVEGDAVVGIAHGNLNGVAILVLLYLQAAFANLVSGADYSGLDGVLVPGVNPDIRIRRLYSQVRPAGNVVGL